MKHFTRRLLHIKCLINVSSYLIVIRETFTSPKCQCENPSKAVCHMQINLRDIRFSSCKSVSQPPLVFRCFQNEPLHHLGSDLEPWMSVPRAGLASLHASTLHSAPSALSPPQRCSLTAQERTCKYALKTACYFHSLDGACLWVPVRTARHRQVQGICHQSGGGCEM